MTRGQRDGGHRSPGTVVLLSLVIVAGTALAAFCARVHEPGPGRTPFLLVCPAGRAAATRALRTWQSQAGKASTAVEAGTAVRLVVAGEEEALRRLGQGTAAAYLAVGSDLIPAAPGQAPRLPVGLASKELLVEPILLFSDFPTPMAEINLDLARQVVKAIQETGRSPLPGLSLGTLADRRPDRQAWTVAGVFPGAATCLDGSYRLGHPVRLIFDRARGLPPSLQSFARWLTTPAGRASWLGLDPDQPEIRLAAVGDIMLDRGVARAMDRHGAFYPISELAERLAGYDLTVGNLESPFGTSGERVPGKGIWFQADPGAVKLLLKAGFDAVSLANNHTLDYGEEAFLENLSVLDQAAVGHFGGGRDLAEARRPLLLTVSPRWRRTGTVSASPTSNLGSYLRVAFLGYSELADVYWSRETRWSFAATPYRPGVAPLRPHDFASIEEDIRAARRQAEVVIVYYHWGREYEDRPTRVQKELARRTIAAGADLVLGAHPHTVQGVEIVTTPERQGLVAYSLGNFIMDQPWWATRQSMILEVDLDRTGVRGFRIVPLEIDEAKPRPLEPGRATAVAYAWHTLLSAAAASKEAGQPNA